MGAGLHVRRVRESDEQDGAGGERAGIERELRRGDQSSGGSDVRRERESVGVRAAYDIENRMTSPPYIVEGYSYDPAGNG